MLYQDCLTRRIRAASLLPAADLKAVRLCRRPKQCFAHNLGPRAPLDKFIQPKEPHERGGADDGGPEVKFQPKIK